MAQDKFFKQTLRNASQSFAFEQLLRFDQRLARRASRDRDRIALDFLRAASYAPVPNYLEAPYAKAVVEGYDPTEHLPSSLMAPTLFLGTIAVQEPTELSQGVGTVPITPVTGTISVFQASDVTQIGGAADIRGTLLVLEGMSSSAATGTVSGAVITGTMAVSEGASTTSATGTFGSVTTGTMAVTEGADTAAAAGTTAAPVTGTLAVTEGADTTAASGTAGGVATITGTMATTEGKDTSSTTASYFDPSLLSTTPLAWWRADSGVSLTSGRVSNWVDKINSHSIAQATPAKQPVVDATVLNGKSSIFFDGAGRVLVSADVASTWKFLHDGTGCTIFIVWRSFAVTPGIMVLYDTSGVAGGNIGSGLDQDSNTTNPFVANGTGTFAINDIGAGSPMPGQTNLLVETLFKTGHSPNDYVMKVGSTTTDSLNATGTPSASTPTYTLNIGNDAGGVYPSNGYMAEFIVVPGAVTAGDETKMRTYANLNYGT